MSYCELQNLIDRFGEQELIELTDENEVGEIETTQIARAIADVDGLIDSYLSGRYTLPLTEVPLVLTRYACDIVRYDLYDHPTDQISKRFDEAMAFLRDASNGKVSLGINTDGSEPKTDNSATMQSGGNVFNRDDNGFM